MYLLKIAWRNINRHKFRSWISIIAIAIVVIIVVFSRGLMSGFNDSMLRFYIDNRTGHVRIMNEQYRLREILMPLHHSVDGFNNQGISGMTEKIMSIKEVEHVLPRLSYGVMSSVDGSVVRMMGVAVEPQSEKAYGQLPADVVEGRFINSGNEIVAGVGLLDKLNAQVGDSITVMFADSYQSLQGRTYKIVGARKTNVAMLDNNIFYIPLSTAQDHLYMHDEATELLVFGSDKNKAVMLYEKLGELIAKNDSDDKYTLQTWETADPMISVLKEYDLIMNMIYVFFILLGTIVLITTMTMIVRERTSEIGMMSALGLKKKEILTVFTLEGSIKGLIGSFVGAIAGGIITKYFSVYGLRVEAFMKAVNEMDVMFEPVFYTSFSAENLIVSFVMSIVIVTIACLYPAWLAAAMRPVDALKA